MPLNKSGSKKAFSENVRTEMHHGKPLKQSLAIAYSTMRRSGHKMAKGGECMACGGSCKYADGGPVGPGGVPLDPEKVKQFHPFSDGGPVEQGFAKTQPVDPDKAKALKSSIFGMPAAEADEPPKKEAYGGSIDDEHPVTGPDAWKKNRSRAAEKEKKVEGVHKPQIHKGVSNAGEQIRDVRHGGQNMKEAGYGVAKKEHEEVLGELKAMPNPKLKGLAHGGKVNLHDQAAKSFMDKGESVVGSSETALPHGLSEGGEAEYDELIDHCCGELIDGFEKKNKKVILDSIKAIVLSLKG